MTKTTVKIISLLKKNNWISGEDIAKELHISRTAVWKHIQQLRKKGYEITAKTHLGYHLDKLPESLTTEEIRDQLHTSLIGHKLYHFESMSSTNDYAKKIAKKDESEGTIIFADEQTGARGRKQRPWSSPKGGLWFSVILRPPIPPPEAMKVTMCAACALAKTLDKQMAVTPSIKWPNDILINDKKVCGILTELSAEIDTINYLIIGIGLNVNNNLPKELERVGTSLKKETKKTVKNLPLLVEILESLDRFYISLLNDDSEIIRKTWISYSSTIGSKVSIQTEKEKIIGKAIDLGINGELILQTSHGEKKIITGDITYL